MGQADDAAEPAEATPPSHEAERVGHMAIPVRPEHEADATAGGHQAAQTERAAATPLSHPAEQVGHADATAGHRLETGDAATHREKARARGEELQNALDRIELSAGSRPLGALLLGVALSAGIIAAGLLAYLAVFVLLVGVIR